MGARGAMRWRRLGSQSRTRDVGGSLLFCPISLSLYHLWCDFFCFVLFTGICLGRRRQGEPRYDSGSLGCWGGSWLGVDFFDIPSVSFVSLGWSLHLYWWYALGW